MDFNYQISIIIPHYDDIESLKYLLSTIPDRDEIQVIIVDDQSTDDVQEKYFELSKSYNPKRYLFLENESPDHNAGAARNIGLQYAEGKWLLFADADDYFLEGFYDKITPYLNTNIDIVFFTPTSQQIDTGKIDSRHLTCMEYIKFYLQNPCLYTETRLKYLWIYPWSKLISNYMVQENNILFDSVSVSNDAMFSYKIAKQAQKIEASEEIIYCVTRKAGSLTTKLDKETFEIRAQVDIRKYQYLKNNLSKEEFKATEAYTMPLRQLFLIIHRKYGLKFFFKYLKIFRQNKLRLFDIRIFTPHIWRRWFRGYADETKIKKHYE